MAHACPAFGTARGAGEGGLRARRLLLARGGERGGRRDRSSFTSEPTARVATWMAACAGALRGAARHGAGWSAGFAAGRRAQCWRQTALWKAKRVAKALGGSGYLKAARGDSGEEGLICAFCSLAFAAAAFAQTMPLKERVLILVNDRFPRAFRGSILCRQAAYSAANILRLKTSATEEISGGGVQRPDRNARCANFWTPMTAPCAAKSSTSCRCTGCR